MKLAALAFLPLAFTGTTEPADPSEAISIAVEQAFADYLATLDPLGEEFYAETCAPLEREPGDLSMWACYAIDEGIIYASLELPVIGDGAPFVFDAYRVDPTTGTPLPGTVMTG